jgi:hypothetical protein
MKFLLFVAATIVLGFFAGIWTWIGNEVLTFQPTEAHKTLEFSDKIVSLAGLLATTVGAATASVLGFEIKKANDGGGGRGEIAKRLNDAVLHSAFLICGVLLYMGVGVFILIVWLWYSPDTTPELVGAFATGVIGWLVGAFTATFKM